jgi:hypothetical protein
MTRHFADRLKFPLRDHGTPLRVDGIWRRLERDLGRPERQVAARLLAPAALVLVFGFGVFVGARFVRPDVAPALGPERPVALEPPARRTLPGARREEAPKPEPSARQTQRSRALAAPEEPAEDETPIAPLVPIVETPVVAAAPPAWERLAEAGDFEAARAALDVQGGFEAAMATGSASQLMTLVDIARASGSKESAVLALRRVVDAFPGAPEAPDAAWTLGNMLAQAGDQAGAADAFALYRRLSPGGDFAQDALAHEVDAAFARGDLELSARLVAQYENEFPNGPRLDEFRAEQERRLAKAKGAKSGSSETPEDPEAVLDEDDVPSESDPVEASEPGKSSK